MTERCSNCKFLRKLWWWNNYPYDKQYGYCCIALDVCRSKDERNELGVVMQLQNTLGKCEMYTEVEKDEV